MDFKANIGIKDKDEKLHSFGSYGIGIRNERGERLIGLAEQHRLTIVNTLLKKKDIGHGRIHRREITTDCGVIRREDKCSDHRLVRMKIKVNKNWPEQKRSKS